MTPEVIIAGIIIPLVVVIIIVGTEAIRRYLDKRDKRVEGDATNESWLKQIADSNLSIDKRLGDYIDRNERDMRNIDRRLSVVEFKTGISPGGENHEHS